MGWPPLSLPWEWTGAADDLVRDIRCARCGWIPVTNCTELTVIRGVPRRCEKCGASS